MKKNWQTVMLSDKTKKQLKDFKKNETYESIIRAMVNYFNITGYNPIEVERTLEMDLKNEFGYIISHYLEPIKQASLRKKESKEISKGATELAQKLKAIAKPNKYNAELIFFDKKAFNQLLQSFGNE